MIEALHVIADVSLMILIFIYDYKIRCIEEIQDEHEQKLINMENTINALLNRVMHEHNTE